jgi:hypothetical protein
MLREPPVPLLVFFSVIPKEPAQVTTADVFAFLHKQRAARVNPKLVRLEDGDAGLAVRTIKRRLASDSGLFSVTSSRVGTSA